MQTCISQSKIMHLMKKCLSIFQWQSTNKRDLLDQKPNRQIRHFCC